MPTFCFSTRFGPGWGGGCPVSGVPWPSAMLPSLGRGQVTTTLIANISMGYSNKDENSLTCKGCLTAIWLLSKIPKATSLSIGTQVRPGSREQSSSCLNYSHTSPLRTNSFFNVARKMRVRKLRFFYTQKVMHKLGLRSYEKKIIINLKKEQ